MNEGIKIEYIQIVRTVNPWIIKSNSNEYINNCDKY